MVQNVKVPGAQCDNVGEEQGYMPISIRHETQEIQTGDNVSVYPVMVTHWKLTDVELHALLTGGLLSLTIMGTGWPPIMLEVLPGPVTPGHG